MELEMYRRYSQMARGIEKAELVFKNGRVFSSGTGEFIDGDVAVADGIVIGVGTYEGETEIDLEGKVAPAAAEKWEISEDGLTWKFNLRKNAKWPNGDPVTAHDFVFGW